MRLVNLVVLVPLVLAGCADQSYVIEESAPADTDMDLPASPSVDSQIVDQEVQERGVDYREVYKEAEEDAPNLGPNAPGYVPPPPD